jgi:hypothetical protein
MALAVAGAFAVPAAASAAGDSVRTAQASAGAGKDVHPRGTSLDPHGRFDELDVNHDGYVSRDEARNAEELNTRFSELDRDNDSKLTRQEYNAFEADRRAQGHGSTDRAASGATSAGRARNSDTRQPSVNPRSESGTTK